MVLLTAAARVNVTNAQKWHAVFIALGVILLLWIFASVSTGSWNPWKLVEGADGSPSTSKLQWLVWIVAIVFAYVVLWVARAEGGNYAALSNVPTNLLAVLGFSTGTAVAAKGITSGQVNSKKVAKPTAAAATAGTGGGAAPGGIFMDDSGAPELAKIQIVGFTTIAVGIFLATVIHQLHTNPVNTSLPDIDSSLLVLMGISQGGYLGKKLVSAGSPGLFPLSKPMAAPGSSVTLKGVSLGGSQSGSELQLDGRAIAAGPWSDTAITFNVPPTPPGAGAYWHPDQAVKLRVVVNGQATNAVDLKIGPAPVITTHSTIHADAGTPVTIEYGPGS
jgi:hypothetical protein